MIESIRLRHWLVTEGIVDPDSKYDADDDEYNDYNPKLYVKTDWKPPPADTNLEHRMMEFASRFERATLAYSRQRAHKNLSTFQYGILRELKRDTRFFVCLTDKNLGPAIIERDTYFKRCLDDHLEHTDTYRRLTEKEAGRLIAATQQQLQSLISLFSRSLTKAMRIYFKRSLKQKLRTPQFYVTMKVHKTPWATRPVVSCVGSHNEIFSKWLDDQMKRLLPLSPTYLRDSNQVLDDLAELGPLPSAARLFTADARSMYTNINTQHALEVFHLWFARCPDEIPPGFPKTLFLRTLEIVMTRNIFQSMTRFGCRQTELQWARQ